MGAHKRFIHELMRILLLLLSMISIPAVLAETWINVENNVSTGKIVIDGQEFGNSTGQYLKGSGKKNTISRDLSGYQRIQVGIGAFDVNYKSGKSYSLTITGDDNIIPLINTEVTGGILKLSLTRSYSSKIPITVSITSPELEAITVSGSSTVRLSSIHSSNFSIQSSGTADISASGQVENLKIQLFGTGDLNLKKLVADQVQVKIEGAGDIVLTARKSLTAAVSGTGDLVYYGRPKQVHTDISGVGDIEPGD